MKPDKQLLRLATRGPRQVSAKARAGLRRRMVQDFVLCVVPKLDSESRSAGGIYAPNSYELGGGEQDKLFLGEVLDVGPGVTINGQHESMAVAQGEIILCNLSNLSYRITERGRKTYQLRNGIILAVLDRKDFSVRPVLNCILVTRGKSRVYPDKTVEQRSLEHMTADGTIWLPTEAMETDDQRERRRFGSAIVAEYGEVVAQGPGRWKDGNWIAPACKAGDLILYDASYGTLPITIKGEQYTLVPSEQMAQIADEV